MGGMLAGRRGSAALGLVNTQGFTELCLKMGEEMYGGPGCLGSPLSQLGDGPLACCGILYTMTQSWLASKGRPVQLQMEPFIDKYLDSQNLSHHMCLEAITNSVMFREAVSKW